MSGIYTQNIPIHIGAKASADGTIAIATATIVLNSTNVAGFAEEWDTNGWFNPANGQFTPLIQGYYRMRVNLEADQLAASGTVNLRKGGVTVVSDSAPVLGSSAYPGRTADFYCNGSTDYLDATLTGDAAWRILHVDISFSFLGT